MLNKDIQFFYFCKGIYNGSPFIKKHGIGNIKATLSLIQNQNCRFITQSLVCIVRP